MATSSTVTDSGLMDVLLAAFEQRYPIRVEVTAKGSGEALRLGRAGQADVLLVHARERENEFIMAGFGVNRRDVMYNDFILLGPAEDPVEVRSTPDILEANRQIAWAKAAFVSRGDDSGTHTREKELWALAGITPNGSWYRPLRAGMAQALRAASSQQAYCLSDRATYRFHQAELNLAVLMEGDMFLHNPYGVIAVNPATAPTVNFRAAMAFIDFLTSAQGQSVIATYGEAQFGQALFHPVISNSRSCAGCLP